VFFNGTETLFYLHKTALALLVLMALQRFDKSLPALVATLADSAFAIHFLHLPAMPTLIAWALPRLEASAPLVAHLASMLVLFVVSVAASLLVVRGLRVAVGRRSRWLVGA
jgi:surface polysaccharide O-acyltransferase-like enzyme